MINTMATSVPYNTGGHLAMPRQINQQPLYNPIDDHRARMYDAQNSYNIKPKPILSPPQTHLSTGNGGNNSMGYTWEHTLPPPKRLSDSSNSTSSSNYDNNFSPPNHHSHSHSHNPHSGNSSSAEIMAPPSYFGGYGAPVPMTTTTTTTAMGHTNSHNSYSTEHMSGMDHNGNGSGTGNANTDPYSMSNAEYHRHRGSGSSISGYYDGAAHRNASVGQVSDIPRGVGDGGWA
ncbi:hypothetical protein ABKA04_005684 [Annulohypoxylon sp. FPYF3050]